MAPLLQPATLRAANMPLVPVFATAFAVKIPVPQVRVVASAACAVSPSMKSMPRNDVSTASGSSIISRRVAVANRLSIVTGLGPNTATLVTKWRGKRRGR